MKVVVVDYGAGNLWSIGNALKKCNCHFTISSSAKEIMNADKLILPGVGAFKRGMEELERLRLSESIRSFAASNKPLLGICLGMQMLLDESEEFGLHRGLGLIPGRIKKIPSYSKSGEILKIPFVSWGELEVPDPVCKTFSARGIMANIPVHSHVYFIHSYSAHLENEDNLKAYTVYSDYKLAALIQQNNIFGVQFHPEKSGVIGLEILRNFLEL